MCKLPARPIKPITVVVAVTAAGLIASLALHLAGYTTASRIVRVVAAAVAFLPLMASVVYLMVLSVRKPR